MRFEYKTNKKNWKEEAETCLNYALNKIQNEYRNVNINEIVKRKILSDYYNYCAIFDCSYIVGNLDSFQKAACLMTAIQKNKILFYGDNQLTDIGKVIFSKKTLGKIEYIDGGELKAQFALNSALKMCEKPICYVGEKCNELKQLETFKLSQFISEYSGEWELLKHELLVTSYYSKGKYNETLSKYLMLKNLYKYVNTKLNQMDDELVEKEHTSIKKVKNNSIK